MSLHKFYINYKNFRTASIYLKMIHGKNNSAKISKNVIRYGSENSFVMDSFITNQNNSEQNYF